MSSFASNMQRHFSDESWRIKVPEHMVPQGLIGKEVATLPKYSEVMPGVYGRLRDHLMSRSEIIGKLAAMMNMEAHIFGVETDIEEWNIELIPMEPDFVEDLIFRRFIHLWMTSAWRLKALRSETYYLRSEAEKYLSDIHSMKVDFTLHGQYKEYTVSPRDADSAALFEWFLKAQEAFKTGGDIPDIPRTLVSDDELILQYDLKVDRSIMWIITADIKLAREYAVRRIIKGGTRCRTFVLNPRYLILSRVIYSHWDRACDLERIPRITEDNSVVDQGSFDASFSQIVGKAVGSFDCRRKVTKLGMTFNHAACGKLSTCRYEDFSKFPSMSLEQMEFGIKNCPNHDPDNPSELNRNRNRLIYESTEVRPLLPYETYRDNTIRYIVQSSDFGDEEKRAVIRDAEVRMGASTFARIAERYRKGLPHDY